LHYNVQLELRWSQSKQNNQQVTSQADVGRKRELYSRIKQMAVNTGIGVYLKIAVLRYPDMFKYEMFLK